MNYKVAFGLSVLVNVLLMVVLLVITATPIFDVTLFEKSSKTVCDQLKEITDSENEKNVLTTFCDDWDGSI